MLGTFAMYSGAVREPDANEIALINAGSRLAGIAIDRELAHRRIAHMAHHDSLTGLSNRTLLMKRLDDALARAGAAGHGVTLAFIDIDNLKLINDTLGHSTGDQILSVLAERMSSCVRGSDTVARLGGDEFVILYADHKLCREPIMAKVESLRHSLSEPIEIDGQLRHVTASIGIATYPSDGDTPQKLLMNADAAMYRAKELGRNKCQIFTAEITSAAREKYDLQEGLRRALANQEFSLVYQPQVDLEFRTRLCRRGANPVAAPDAWNGTAFEIHTRCGSLRIDRTDRRLGVTHRLRAGQDMAKSRAAAHRRVRQRLGSPVRRA